MNRLARVATWSLPTALAVWVASSAASTPRRDPGPAPQQRAAAWEPAAENTRCEGCHQAIAAEWRDSLHHTSSTDPAYQRQLAREPLPFCRACHAPEADPMRGATGPAHTLGVGCVTCHVVASDVLAAPSNTAGDTTAPHAVTRSADFATDAACARCHEFSFPDASRRAHPALMQSTVSEHRASAFADVSCASCHMGQVGEGRARHRDHRFAASRDPAFVASAVRATVSRLEGGKVRFRLEPRALGHAFPTGDLFRRIALDIEAVGPDFSVIAGKTRYLARHFKRGLGTDEKPLKVLAWDDRVGLSKDETSEIVLDLGPAMAGVTIAYRVAYQRVDLPDDTDEDDARIEGEIVLASGVLSAAPR